MTQDLKDKTLQELQSIASQCNGKKFWADYLFSFIHEKGAAKLADITPLSQAFRDALQQAGYFISSLETVQTFHDPDGTVKYLFQMPDGVRVESVLMEDDGRKTVCLSCQAGCRMGCRFCATGKLTFKRNLTAAEMADQVNTIANNCGHINNVVYMGMGEPMDNLEEVLRSVEILICEKGKNIGQRHITVSTCGIPDGILRLAEFGKQIRLALSLHTASDRKRRQLMPVAARYTVTELQDALQRYQQLTGRRVTIECCMIEGITDSPRDIENLLAFVKGLKVHVNLIEYNPHPGCTLRASSRESIRRFADRLRAGGLEVANRYKRGRQIRAACGQLGADWLENRS